MWTICTFSNKSNNGSPISRIVTSHPPQMATPSSAKRAAMLRLLFSTSIRARPQLLDLLHHLGDYLCEARSFGSRYPLQTEPLRLQSEILQHQGDSFCARAGAQVAFQIMTIARVTPEHQHSIGALGQRLNYQIRMNHAAALHAENTDVGGILQSRGPGEVGAGIRAPVTAESHDQRLPPFAAALSGRLCLTQFGFAHLPAPQTFKAAWICAISCSGRKCQTKMPFFGQVAWHVPQPLHTASSTDRKSVV